jgi:hypothetical protein
LTLNDEDPEDITKVFDVGLIRDGFTVLSLTEQPSSTDVCLLYLGIGMLKDGKVDLYYGLDGKLASDLHI